MRSTSSILSGARRPATHQAMEGSPCAVCGNVRELHTSWIPLNPGRRFVACPKEECKDFAWVDPPMCERSVQIIPRLLRKRNKMEEEISRRKKREKMLWIALGISWLIFGFFWAKNL
ncbi:hypothetical protein Vadar_010959 [Vaccinium darrowii]|uniref:Uncharacterized protein n=1 Tax=Vaccinium darrowii TaxID=229202 RepID=A0ACB7XH41_9ERIC|nr:hypothetical protein Vadar_010959 [Vaccinium darrowii]